MQADATARGWLRRGLQGRKELAVAVILLCATAIGFCLHARALGWPIVDDAGISLAYGRSFWESGTFRATPNSQVVEGFSSPAWTLLVGIGPWLPFSVNGWMAFLGIGFGALALALFAFWLPVAEDRRLRIEDALGMFLGAANPSYAGWCASGMETGLWAFGLAVAGLLCLRAMRTGAHRWTAGLALGALLFIRPEAPLFVLLVVPVWWFVANSLRRHPWREALQPALAVAAVLAVVLIARWLVFSDVIANSAWAKRYWEFDGRGYLFGFAKAYRLPLVAALIGLLVSLPFKVSRSAVLVAAAWIAGVVLTARAGDWMGEWRFVAPGVPLLGVLAAGGLGRMRELSVRSSLARPLRFAAGAACLALLVLVAFGLRESFGRFPAVRASPQYPFDFVRKCREVFWPTVEALGQRRPLLVLADLGGTSWELREAEIIDGAGLCDRAVAQHSWNAAAIEDYLVWEGPPAIVDIHGPTNYLRGLGLLMKELEPYEGMWKAKNLTRDEDPRCPGGKAAVLALDRQTLGQALTSHLDRDDAVTALRLWRCALAYQPDDRLPEEAVREALVERAVRRSRALEGEGRLEPSLRMASFATVASGHSPALRRRAEAIRSRLFPSPR